ncbi:MAG: redox-sensing transcriptional repressor Rex [Chloroflexia bacterium]|nr:redox-sensing transcriptional repressor Rex [Chloroflexia bacterium]
MAQRPVPDVVVRRLTQYYRALLSCRDRGLEVVSSQMLGEMLNVTAAQIRKDLSYFGGFGKQGIGYNVANLLEHLKRILGLTETWPMALIGIGNLGQALLHYRGFAREGFEIVALFDSDPHKVGQIITGLTVHADQQIPQLIPQLEIKIALLSIPTEKAQEAADMLIQAGVQAILNYAPVTLRVPEDVWVRQMDPLAALESMTFYLAAAKETP